LSTWRQAVGPGSLNPRTLLAVVTAAVALRLVVFCLSVWSSMTLSIPSAENWQDFALAYVPAANALKSGFLPYLDFYYPYPPLFLYALTAFTYLPMPSWSSALPLVVGDALTVVPVYLIARELGGDRVALVASAAFVVSPLNLYYVDYLWLNPSLTSLFLMTSVYFLLKRRYGLSAAALAVSFGFKQTALLALPVIALVVLRRGSPGEARRYLGYVLLICLVVSLPFLLFTPAIYLSSVLMLPFYQWFPLSSNYFTLAVGNGTIVSFNTLVSLTSKWQLVAGAINAPVSLSLPLFIFLVPSSLAWSYAGVGNLSYLILVVGYVLLLYRILKSATIGDDDVVMFLLLAFLFFFTVYPLYKYYVVGLVPFLVLLMRSRKAVLGFATFSVAILLVPRYLGSWVLLVTLVWILARRLAWRRGPAVVQAAPPARSPEPAPA